MKHALRVRRQTIQGQVFCSLWLVARDGAAESGRLHGSMWPDAAEHVIEIFERAGVEIEREPEHPNTDAMTCLPHGTGTVEETIQATQSKLF